MKLQVLVSTMNQRDHALIERMNIRTDAVIINQCGTEGEEAIHTPYGTVNWINMNERGLSKSRNAALQHAEADIALIADDDVTYYDDYEKTILDAYRRYPKADICAFYLQSTDPTRPTSKPLKQGYISYLNSMRLASFMLSFKPEALSRAGIAFDEHFGAGSGMYSMGEDNIVLIHCLKKGLKLAYDDHVIGTVTHAQSTWWNGTYTEKLMHDKGAMFYEISRLFSTALIWQFAVRKYPLYKKDMTFKRALKIMLLGKKEYADRLTDRV